MPREKTAECWFTPAIKRNTHKLVRAEEEPHCAQRKPLHVRTQDCCVCVALHELSEDQTEAVELQYDYLFVYSHSIFSQIIHFLKNV